MTSPPAENVPSAFEKDLQERFDKGEFTPTEWRDFWWKERANTLQEIGRLEAGLAALKRYAERSTARIEAVKL